MKVGIQLLMILVVIFVSFQITNAIYVKKFLNEQSGDHTNEGFEVVKIKPFRHLKILAVSENGGLVKVENNPEFQAKCFFQLSDKVSYKNIGDTLVVNLKKGYYDIENNKGAFPVIIGCENLESVYIQSSTVEFVDYNNPKIKVIAKKQGHVRIEGEYFSKNLDINLSDESTLNFYLNKPYQMDKIVANISNGSSLNMPNIFPIEMNLYQTDDSNLGLNGATLKLLRK